MNDDTKFILWMVFTMSALSLGLLLFLVAILRHAPFQP